VLAILELRRLIEREHRDLAAAGATVDERRQSVGASRLKGDYLLEQVNKGSITLKAGDQSLSVTRIQQALADLGHLASTDVSGTYDVATAAGVRSFQRATALTENGIVDRSTMAALDQAFRSHGAERTLAQAPAVAAKSAAGEFGWGTAPAELMVGTRDLTAGEATAARDAVKTSLTAGAGGLQPTFVSNLPGRGTYEARLKALVLWLVQLEYDQLAKGKADHRADDDLFQWDHIRAVAERSKAATDAVFGKWAVGPPLAPGVSIHDAWETKVNLLKDVDAQDAAANWRVEKILTGHPHVRELDREHGAIQTRGPEKVIVDRVKAQIVAAKRAELIETHKAWPAFAADGVVNIQRFKSSTDRGNRREMWDLFQTVVHEYLHTLEHSRYRGYREGLGQQAGGFTLREGVVEYLTHTVLESINYADADLRRVVEGDFHDPDTTDPVPTYHGYTERANAEKLAGVVGARNVMAAFFLGDVEKVGGTI
jgi:peptidoglycan hydrolase-like protein with peptidoglycan-binding domain